MADNKVTLEIQVDAKDAEKAIAQFGAGAIKSIKNVEKSTSGMGASFSALGATAAASLAAVVGGFAAVTKGINEALESERGIRQLSLAIAATGEFSQGAIDGLTEYANTLSDLTGIEDDAIVASLTLAKTFGISNDQAKALVDSAADLSAITGDSLESAVRLLGGTLDGTVGKVGKLGPAFRNLTEEQLKNGDAIKLINKQYGDAAETLGAGFEGNLNRVSNAFKDALKEIGNTIIGDGSITYLIKLTADTLKALAPVIGFITKIFVDGIKSILKGFTALAAGLGAIVSDISSLFNFDDVTTAADNFSGKMSEIFLNLNGNIDQTTGTTDAFNASLERTNQAAKPAVTSISKLSEEAKKFITSINSDFGTESDKAIIKAQEALVKLDGFVKEGAIAAAEAAKLRLKIESKLQDDLIKIQDDAYKKQLDDAAKQAADMRKISEEQQANLTEIGNNPIKIAFEQDINMEKAGTALAGFFNKALSGKQGAVSAMKGVASALGGPVVGEIFGKLAEGKEAVKGFITEFIDAIPEIIINVVEALPEAISTLIEKVLSPEFLTRLGFALGKALVTVFTGGLISFLPRWGEELGKALLVPLDKFIKGFEAIFNPILDAFKAIQNAFDPLVNALGSVNDALHSLIGPIEDLINALSGGLGGGGGGGGIGGFFEKAGDFLGFAKGGVVPKYAASGLFVPRGTDTVPAMLTPGERVLSTNSTQQFDNFISQNANNAAMLGAIMNLLSQPQNIAVEAKVNQSAFADIILQLNRQNARLTA